jgi:hypothetical protein
MKQTREGDTKKKRVLHGAAKRPSALDTVFTKSQQWILLQLIDARMAPLKARVSELEKALAAALTPSPPPPPPPQDALDLPDIDLDSFLAADTPF